MSAITLKFMTELNQYLAVNQQNISMHETHPHFLQLQSQIKLKL